MCIHSMLFKSLIKIKLESHLHCNATCDDECISIIYLLIFFSLFALSSTNLQIPAQPSSASSVVQFKDLFHFEEISI